MAYTSAGDGEDQRTKYQYNIACTGKAIRKRLSEGMPWQNVSCAHLEQCSDAVFWFSPQAFCYYLPGILAAGLRENRWDVLAYDSLIGCLDRSPRPDYWDDFFLPRWTRLTAAEVHAVAAWVRWLELVQPDAFYRNTYERVQETLRLLQARQSSQSESEKAL